MRKVWLPNGVPGLEQYRAVYCYRQTGIVGQGILCLAGFLAIGPGEKGIPLHLRHTTGFEVDALDSQVAGRPSESTHDVFLDLPPVVLGDIELLDSVQNQRCFGNACSLYIRGAPHKCPIGRCQKFEDAIICHI